MAEGFFDPPREFGPVPFWFWNDALDEKEILRQISSFEAHGVYGFVLHPRVGLPREIGWMSERMLQYVRVAVEEADRRGMQVILYDEGMYPSGSSSGQVVAEDPTYRCRCLAKVDLEGELPGLPEGHHLVAAVDRATGGRMAVIDRPVDAYIRGLHYVEEGPEEDEPAAADLLNPNAMATFIRLVYDGFAEAVGAYFGKTVIGMFTDEPGLLGKCRETGVLPGTTGILQHVNKVLGYDFTPHLPALWYDDEPDAQQYREAYLGAVNARLEETYYRPLSDWCSRHGIALCGHPAQADEIGLLRYFQVPGQGIVWRRLVPGNGSGLEGPESTQAKCSSSAMIHLGRRRNSNECFGAYGHAFTREEMKWVSDWCFVRGVNLLIPHAFYYSVRGCRRDERPPDVGPNSSWWDDYRRFSDYCRRLSWLNTDSRQVCSVAILGASDRLPWEAAKVCFEHQRDFNYLEMRHLIEDAEVDEDGVHLGGMHYRVVIVDGKLEMPLAIRKIVEYLSRAGRVVVFGEGEVFEGAAIARTSQELVVEVDARVEVDLEVGPSHPELRYRHVVKEGTHYYLLCNEGLQTLGMEVEVSVGGQRIFLDPVTGKEREVGSEMELAPYTLCVLKILSNQGRSG